MVLGETIEIWKAYGRPYANWLLIDWLVFNANFSSISVEIFENNVILLFLQYYLLNSQPKH
jgi:hypothetical protein